MTSKWDTWHGTETVRLIRRTGSGAVIKYGNVGVASRLM